MRVFTGAEEVAPTRVGLAALDGLLVLLGVGALLLRSRVLSQPAGERLVTLACIYAAILAGCALATTARSPARANPGVVLVIGMAAVVVAARASGRPPGLGFVPLGLPLSILAAVAEEALFRKTAYGWLLRRGAATAIAGSAVLFALVHLPLYGPSAMPVDVGAGLLFGWQRWVSGSWKVPAATHAAANILAVVLR